MSKQSNRTAKSAASARRGAAFLLLVMMVLLIIVSATQWMVTSSIAIRKGDIARVRARSMMAAINQAQAIAPDLQGGLRLPLDETKDERIEIIASPDGASLTATWMRGSTELGRMIRPLNSQSDSTRLADKQIQDPGKP